MSLALSNSQTLTLRARPAAPPAHHLVAGSNDGDGDRAAGLASVCVNSTDLLRGQKAVEINHNGSTYRLQATRLGKLILTK